MYSREQAMNIIIDKVFDGVREADILRLKKSSENLRKRVLFRVLLEEYVSEFKNGWIFRTRSRGFEKDGKLINFIGAGLSVTLNRKITVCA